MHSKRLMELMGGSIGVESVAGEGSTFWIELPAGVESVEEVSHVTALAGGAGSSGGTSARKQITVLYI